MSEDIIINGVSVNELKRQREAIRQGATALVSNKIDEAKELTKQLLELDDLSQIEALAAKAYEALETANVVSGVAGVSFFLPYYDEYGYDDETPFTSLMESEDNKTVSGNIWGNAGTVELKKLYNLFSNMETQSRDWHQSRC